ncbi:MAG: FG-GAP repeat protein [Planctomycetes bacterium]|nr:FG-GAP repeat protein [Planctomycetota bacterium]
MLPNARYVPLACSLLAALGGAQTSLYVVDGAPFSGADTRAAFAGDVDGDGLGDWIVGVPTDDGAAQNGGVARVYAGVDGALLYTLTGGTGDYLGYAFDGVGDLDGDGRQEFVVSAPRAAWSGQGSVGVARVYDGATGAVRFTVGGSASSDWFGASVSGAGDLNADGVPDFVVGAVGADNAPNDGAGAVYAYSGADGSLLWQRFGTTGSGFGHCVNELGDVNGDGKADVVASALDVDQGNAAGYVRVLSGANGAPLLVFPPGSPLYWFGVSCDGAGDADGDGVPDVVIGIRDEPAVAGTGQGAVDVRSGATGALLRRLRPLPGTQRFGVSVAGAGDVDGDGRDDIVVGQSRDQWGLGNQGSATVFSGLDGSVIFKVYGEALGDEQGTWVDGGAHVDADGSCEVLTVAPFNDAAGNTAGRTRVLRLATPQCLAVARYCTALPNSTGVAAQLDFSGTTSVSGNDFFLRVSGGVPGQPGLFYFGPNQIAAPFGNGVRCVGGAVRRFGVAIAEGHGYVGRWLDVTAPQTGGVLVPGSTHDFQYWYRDPGIGAHFNLSDALAVTFCP